jgi:2-polyprenyl-3-methyl-5-hydroxy-6-metoxy-1,4-benzoquinol methylase
MFFPRSMQKEIMDDFSIQDSRLTDALKELNVINTFLGGNAVSRRGISVLMKQIPERRSISLLDVGSGGSDFSHSLPADDRTITLTSLDINYGACKYSRDTYPAQTVVNGSVLNLPFKERSFDIVHASLFLHHFTERELNTIIFSLYHISRYGVVINDLRRSLLAYIGIVALTQLFSRSDMVKNDGPISVRRGFVYKELKQLCSQLPSASNTIRRMWAFRWCITISKEHAAQ